MTAPGRRAAHKAQTRAAIRAAALTLIAAQGYAATTVTQIAEAAQISHTTLFRYFDSKEQLLVDDGLDAAREELFARIPPGLGHFALARQLVTELYTTASDDEWASNPQRLQLIRTEPVLRMAAQLQADQMLQDATEFIASYAGVASDALSLRVFIAALSGVMMHLAQGAVTPADSPLDELLTAIDLLERGLPLE